MADGRHIGIVQKLPYLCLTNFDKILAMQTPQRVKFLIFENPVLWTVAIFDIDQGLWHG